MMFRKRSVLAFLAWSLCLALFSEKTMASTVPANPANFSCYQCAVTSLQDKCGPETLKPCQHTSDRCVTHITKSPSTSLLVRRECGLGPCSFESLNSEATAVLGMDHCDATKPDIFCVICCKESGCNAATYMKPSILLIFAIYLSIHSGFLR